MNVELEYVSVGCNRTPHAADWSSAGVLAYGASRSVALAKETEEGRGPSTVFATLHGHSERVNCVRWIIPLTSPASPTELVSGGVDGKVIVWRGERDKFSIYQELTSHKLSVTCVAAVYLLPGNSDNGEAPPIKTLIASTSSDSTVNIWERPTPDSEFSLLQSIFFGRGFALGLDFCVLPNSTEPMLACGGDDARVNLFALKDGKFCRVLSLTGHEDWVRDVQFTRENGGGRGDLLLASCSQDTSIRLWRITQQQQQQQQQQQDEEGELKLKGNTFTVSGSGGEVTFGVTLESILMGHENWVYSVRWHLSARLGIDQSDCNAADHHMQLLSSSMDKTVIIWTPDSLSGVWLEKVRVGEVGGTTLGFYGGLFSPGGQLILAHDYQGGFHLWGREGRKKQLVSEDGKTSKAEKAEGEESLLEVWASLPTIGGHFAAVQGLAWEPRAGRFLLSVSSDQTARLHAAWQCSAGKRLWCEIARPQIHGYDMTCVAMTTPLQYTSGADEKVLRVFEAAKNFVGNLRRICQEHLVKEEGDAPIGASVPSLGLSNKAVFTCTDDSPDSDKQITKNPFADHIPPFKPVNLDEPPVEAHLLQNTLWPETQKLYGHGYEIYCVASSPDGLYVASACKATKAEHAVVRMWEVGSWRQLPPLPHHTLTITHLTFSHSSRLLLATSRDRCWSLWKRTNTKDSPFQLAASLDKSSRLHSRVIWTASWSHDDGCFATGSRDKKVLLWRQGGCEGGGGDCGEGWGVMSPPLECTHPVTALDFSPSQMSNGRHVLAVGLESGQILLHYCSLSDSLEWNLATTLEPTLWHTATVKQLSWKPLTNSDAEHSQLEHATLASCSHDNSVKLFRIKFT